MHTGRIYSRLLLKLALNVSLIKLRSLKKIIGKKLKFGNFLDNTKGSISDHTNSTSAQVSFYTTQFNLCNSTDSSLTLYITLLVAFHTPKGRP